MKNVWKSFVSTIALGMTLVAGTANADVNDIQLGHPGYGGTGCPQGSVSTTLSPDNKELSIIFDEFYAEAGGITRKRLTRKNCNIAIPIHIPQGFSVSVVDVDYRGYVSLPRGASARLTTQYFFAGQRGPRFVKRFRGSMDDEYLVNDSLGIVGLVWSRCGAQTNLRVNTSILAKTNRKKEEVLATVDTADFSAGIVYKLQWKRCYL